MNFKPSGTDPRKTDFQIREVEYNEDRTYVVKRMVTVKGKRVFIKGWRMFSFFLHKREKIWFLCEECTGLSVGSGYTAVECMRTAKQNLDKWDKFKLAAKIKDHLSWRVER